MNSSEVGGFISIFGVLRGQALTFSPPREASVLLSVYFIIGPRFTETTQAST